METLAFTEEENESEKKKNGEGIHSKSHRKPGKCGDLKAKRAQYFKEEDIANFVNYSS